MSEIKCHVCGFIGSSADCLGWEHTCTDIMKDKNKALERQLAEARELTNKFIKRTEGIIQALVEDGSEEGHSEFFYRMNSKEQVLHEGFLRKLNKLKEQG